MRPQVFAKASTAAIVIAAGLGTASIAAAQAPAAEPSSAPAPAAGASTALSEVIVTARRRTENLQSVPISVTALTSADVAKQNLVNLNDVGLTVPGFKISPGSANATAPIIMIRGQVQTDTLPTLDPSVGVYVDGVYWSRAVGADAALVDIAGVEVLKGPQGTLFGRNTTGGAMNIRTADPNLNALSGLASITGGTYGELDGTVVVNAPIIEDKLAVRVAVNHDGHDGYSKDEDTGKRLFSQDTDTLRIKVLAQPVDKLRVELTYEAFVLDEEAPPFNLSYYTPVARGGVAAFDALLTTGGTAVLDKSIISKSTSSAANDSEHISAHTQTVGLTTSYDLGFGVLKAILGYRKVYSGSNIDLDGTPLTLLATQATDTSEEGTGELQFNGRAFNNRLEYTAGYYWFGERGTYISEAEALAALNPIVEYLNGDAHSRSQAGYLQGTYKVTDALSITGGLRYSADEKSLDSHNGNYLPTGFSCAVPDDIGGSFASCSQKFHTSSNDLDYTASIDYKITHDIFGYLKVSHGYRAGGLNLRGSLTAESFAPFAPESALNYEAGLKSEFFDRRLRINVAGYYTDYSNIQRSIIVPIVATGTTATVVENAASGKVYGTEVEVQGIVATGLRLGVTFGAIEASYDKYADLLGNHVNEAFPGTPEFTYSLTGDYTRPLPRGNLNVHADWGWQSTTYFATGYTNGGTGSPNFPISSLRQSPYGILNFKVAWQIPDSNLEFAVFGRNALDKTYRTGGLDFVDAGLGFNAVEYGAPATFGVQATYRWGQ